MPQSEEGVRQLLATQNTWPFGLAVDVAFSTDVYKAETWQARLAKVAPELPFVRKLTGWNRRSDATSTEALAFYLFKMALGKPEAAALEPPDSLSNNRIRAALRKAQDQVETELPYAADYGTMFRVARDGALRSSPAGGGTVLEAGMITPRAMTFHHAGAVVHGQRRPDRDADRGTFERDPLRFHPGPGRERPPRVRTFRRSGPRPV